MIGPTAEISTITVSSKGLGGGLIGGSVFPIRWTDVLDGTNSDTERYNILVRDASGAQLPIRWTYVDGDEEKSYEWVVGQVLDGQMQSGKQYFITVCHNYAAKCGYSETFEYVPGTPSASASAFDGLANTLSAISSLIERLK